VDEVRKEFRSSKDLQRGFKEYIFLKEIYSYVSQKMPWYTKITQQYIQEKYNKPNPLVSLTTTIKPGNILISHPSMIDDFSQCVILIVDHGPLGTEGVILDCIRKEEASREIWYGGPMGKATMLHTNPTLEGKHIMNNLFYTQNTSKITDLNEVRLFSSVSSWIVGQLEQEIIEGSWFLAESAAEVLFNVHTTDTGEVEIYLKNDRERIHMRRVLWRKVLQFLGGEYAAFSYFNEVL